MVVHGKAEEEREEEQGQPRLDGARLLKAEQLVADAVLEDENDNPVGGADGEQVHQQRLYGHDDRTEHQQQEHEAQAKHEGEHIWRVLLDHREHVLHLGRAAGHQDLSVDSGESGGNMLVP